MSLKPIPKKIVSKHLLLFWGIASGALNVASAADHVIHISVDGLHSKAISTLGAQNLPNFFRLQNEGLATDFARTDPRYTYTLPNHASMMTGRIVEGGHDWNLNDDPGVPHTIHSNAGTYINSIFDLVHDAGLSTSLFAGKFKFDIFNRSWNDINGAVDNNGVDNGRDKIDRYYYAEDTQALVSEFIADLTATNRNFAFLHLRDPDSVGHVSSWDLNLGSPYMNSVMLVDTYLGDVLNFIENTPPYMNNTAVILVADHAGNIGATSHPPRVAQSHIIPFYLWGKGIAQNEDIYTLNTCIKPPVELRNPEFSTEKLTSDNGAYFVSKNLTGKTSVVWLDDLVHQPARNGDAANVAANLLGLGSIPGSQLLNVSTLQPPAEICPD